MAKEKDVNKKEKKTVVAKGKDLSISTKHSIAICKFLKNKKLEDAIKLMNEVIALKKAVPTKKEAHKKGMASGKFPLKATKAFLKILKNVKSNANSKGMDISKLIIKAKANKASRPLKPGRFRRQFKRTHIEIVGMMK